MSARILLVEDDASIREVTAFGLTRAGFEVATAADGREALRLARANPPDGLVLDLMLPHIDGLEVCRTIRAESSVPIVMLTARTDTIDVVLGLEAGADDYIRKPFELHELVARLRAVLRRSGSDRTGGILHLGPLLIDVAANTVGRGDESIALTHTEFALLVELAAHAGQVLGREQLLDRVWGYDYLGDSRLVDVAVQRLRGKIEADPAHPELIVTVRGAGYRAAR